jgi:hypothetical protein
MRPILLPLALLGCSTTTAELPAEHAAPPPFTTVVSDLVPGESATVTVSPVGFNETALLFLSLQGGRDS